MILLVCVLIMDNSRKFGYIYPIYILVNSYILWKLG